MTLDAYNIVQTEFVYSNGSGNLKTYKNNIFRAATKYYNLLSKLLAF
jgi:hypothetical protein